MRYAAALAALPLLVFGAVAVSRPTPPVPVKPVRTEGVRMIRMDDATFRARWRPLYDIAPATVIHEVHVEGGGALAPNRHHKFETVPAAIEASSSRPPARIVKRASLRQDICARHGLRRVTYSVRGYQHWKCRR